MEYVYLVRTHERKLRVMTLAELAGEGSYGTCGWDYLDDNGKWYAVRALLPCSLR